MRKSLNILLKTLLFAMCLIFMTMSLFACNNKNNKEEIESFSLKENYFKLFEGENRTIQIISDNDLKYTFSNSNDEVIKFDGDYIDAYYHLSSNGKTEDASNVLKLAYPYLKSVDSNWDINSDKVSKRIVPNSYLSKLLNMKITKDTKVDILMKTIGHRVKYIKFDNKVFDGLILSNRLGLNSNDFTVSIENNYTIFITRGNGHGLGLSKYGAEAMARAGYNYKEIIKHYYPNTYIEKSYLLK